MLKHVLQPQCTGLQPGQMLKTKDFNYSLDSFLKDDISGPLFGTG